MDSVTKWLTDLEALLIRSQSNQAMHGKIYVHGEKY